MFYVKEVLRDCVVHGMREIVRDLDYDVNESLMQKQMFVFLTYWQLSLQFCFWYLLMVRVTFCSMSSRVTCERRTFLRANIVQWWGRSVLLKLNKPLHRCLGFYFACTVLELHQCWHDSCSGTVIVYCLFMALNVCLTRSDVLYGFVMDSVEMLCLSVLLYGGAFRVLYPVVFRCNVRCNKWDCAFNHITFRYRFPLKQFFYIKYPLSYRGNYLLG